MGRTFKVIRDSPILSYPKEPLPLNPGLGDSLGELSADRDRSTPFQARTGQLPVAAVDRQVTNVPARAAAMPASTGAFGSFRLFKQSKKFPM